jgi:hypothetical protein
MKHLKLFENFEVVDPIKYGDPLNTKEINFLKGYNVMCPEYIKKDDGYYYIGNYRCDGIKNLPKMYIKYICDKYDIIKYTINDDFSIDVVGDVNLHYQDLTKIPLKFNKVGGDFYCGFNQLTTLRGAPNTVGGDFFCFMNQLTSLEGGPNTVGGSFVCYNNLSSTVVHCKDNSPDVIINQQVKENSNSISQNMDIIIED